MSPRARRSESITSPPANHPGLIRYNDDKSFVIEKPIDVGDDCVINDDDDDEANDDDDDSTRSEITMSSASDDSHDPNDSIVSRSSSVSSMGAQKLKDASAA